MPKIKFKPIYSMIVITATRNKILPFLISNLPSFPFFYGSDDGSGSESRHIRKFFSGDVNQNFFRYSFFAL